MYETPDDLRRLQELLDRSYATAGEHLKSIVTPERRMSAQEVCELLTGMRLLALATTTGDGRPLVGPVDGMFYRGDFWFGSSPDSLRFRHIRERPFVSATHTPTETFSVTVHGTAQEVDLSRSEHTGFCDYCVEYYGDSWRDWGADAVYARVDAGKMFAFQIEI